MSYLEKAIKYLKDGAIVFVNYIPEKRIYMLYGGCEVNIPVFTILRLKVMGYLYPYQEALGVFTSYKLNKVKLRNEHITSSEAEALYDKLNCVYCADMIMNIGVREGLGYLSFCPECGRSKEKLLQIEKRCDDKID